MQQRFPIFFFPVHLAKKKKKTVLALEAENKEKSERLSALEKKKEATAQATAMQGKVQDVLKMQMADLRNRLDSSLEGRQAESEMYDEAVVKAVRMENHVEELTAKVLRAGRSASRKWPP